jgi:hypothetical protein
VGFLICRGGGLTGDAVLDDVDAVDDGVVVAVAAADDRRRESGPRRAPRTRGHVLRGRGLGPGPDLPPRALRLSAFAAPGLIHVLLHLCLEAADERSLLLGDLVERLLVSSLMKG